MTRVRVTYEVDVVEDLAKSVMKGEEPVRGNISRLAALLGKVVEFSWENSHPSFSGDL